MSNVIDFEGYYWDRHGLWDPDEDFHEYDYESLPDPVPAFEPRPRTYDLQKLSELTAKLGRESGFNLGIDETAVEAAFHFAKEQAGRMEVPLEAALEIAAWAVLNYERGRRDPELCRIRPF